jgi:isoquinoline 1-oxidoreductase beta subunit
MACGASRPCHRDLPVPVGFWRAVGHSHQAFFKESFVDECAHAAGRTPWRTGWHCCSATRATARCCEGVAAQPAGASRWQPAADGAPRARGLALHQLRQHRGSGGRGVGGRLPTSPSACTGWWRPSTAAPPSTPTGMRQQMESAVVYGLARRCTAKSRCATGVWSRSNFHDQPLPRMPTARRSRTMLPSTRAARRSGRTRHAPDGAGGGQCPVCIDRQRLRSLPLRLA